MRYNRKNYRAVGVIITPSREAKGYKVKKRILKKKNKEILKEDKSFATFIRKVEATFCVPKPSREAKA